MNSVKSLFHCPAATTSGSDTDCWLLLLAGVESSDELREGKVWVFGQWRILNEWVARLWLLSGLGLFGIRRTETVGKVIRGCQGLQSCEFWFFFGL
jgi:hypothetical protein